MSDEYRYRVSMTCDTHGGIYGYLYCPECTISALRGEVEELRKSYLLDRIVLLEAELSRYRAAVEWACTRLDQGIRFVKRDDDDCVCLWCDSSAFEAELRRRAGEGE